MGFLDRINTNKAAEAAAPKKPNPLAARKNPLAARKPSIPLKPAENKAAEKAEVKEVVETAPVETPAAETAKKTSAVKPDQKPAEEKKETVTEKAEEKVVEATSEETAKSAEKEEAKEPEVKEAQAEKKEETQKTATPKKNNRRNTSGNKKKETDSSNTEEEATFYEIPTTEADYAEAVEAIRSPFRDETWEAFKAEIQEDLANINVTDDLNPGTLKVIIAELSILRDKIWFPLQEAKMEFERYASKEPEGLIERVKRINSGSGNNETERRRAGILACMNYETTAGKVNLYELMDESRERYAFLKSVDESIKFKKDILITMNGALKLEKELL